MTDSPQLELRDKVVRPLIPVVLAMDLLACSEDVVESLICRGKLAAWDIASKDATRRREVRVLRRTVREYLAHTSSECGDGIDEILGACEPHVAALSTMRRVEIARRFFCDPDHVGHLVRDGLLVQARVDVGPKHSPYLLRSSLVEFLKARRIF